MGLTLRSQKAAAASKPKGLAASRHAADDEDEKDGDDAAGDEAEGEPADDHSSAALASVRRPLLAA